MLGERLGCSAVNIEQAPRMRKQVNGLSTWVIHHVEPNQVKPRRLEAVGYQFYIKLNVLNFNQVANVTLSYVLANDGACRVPIMNLHIEVLYIV